MSIVHFDSNRLKDVIIASFPEELRGSLEDKPFGWCVEALVTYNNNLKVEVAVMQETLRNMSYDAKMVSAAKALVDAQRTFASMCTGAGA